MGAVVNLKRIERLMRLAGLRGISRRRGWCVTTRRDKSARGALDLVKRQFTATAVNQLWVTASLGNPAEILFQNACLTGR